MAINFPSAPNSGDSYTDGSQTWIYNGSAWDAFYQPTAKSQVGLGNVDNTSDEDKPVSTAQQAALDALTKDDVGLDNVDNTSDINKPVSTAQQAAIDAAGGGSSFDQDLNTTDSPTFATLTTTDTIATDVYAVDVGATGTVTADEVDLTGGAVRLNGSTKLLIRSNDALFYSPPCPSSNESVDLGVSSRRWLTTHTVDLDASGTVTAGEVTADSAVFNLPAVGSSYALEVQSGGSRNFSVDGYGNVESKTMIPRINSSFDLGSTSRRWRELFTTDIDASGTVKKGVFTVATLPTGEAGMTCFVSDANATTRGSTVAGGGANFMPVYSDGTNWIIS